MSTPAWHYREAEWLRDSARDMIIKNKMVLADYFNAAALVHATLAAAGATVETHDATHGRNPDVDVIVRRPTPADPDLHEQAYPGSEWGRAFYGDLHVETGDAS